MKIHLTVAYEMPDYSSKWTPCQVRGRILISSKIRPWNTCALTASRSGLPHICRV